MSTDELMPLLKEELLGLDLDLILIPTKIESPIELSANIALKFAQPWTYISAYRFELLRSALLKLNLLMAYDSAIGFHLFYKQ